jgi:AmmeMemoRadiSam system protein B
MSSPARPRLRPIEMLPFVSDEGDAVLLRDPAGIGGDPVALAPAGAFLASRFDGGHTLEEIRAELVRATGGVVVNMSDVEGLVRLLDERGFIEGQGYQRRLAAAKAEWDAAPARAPAHAPAVYPTEPEALRSVLTGYWRAGPGTTPTAGEADPALRGVFAPHIDLRAGGTVMAQAYDALVRRAPDADLFILLGTGHAPCEGRLALTRKDYDTPLGRLRTDVGAVEALAGGIPGDAFASELNHKHEHSLEFQAVFLVHALQMALGPEASEKVRAVPVLVGSFHDLVARGADPMTDPQIAGLVEGIQSLVRAHPGRAVVVGGVDLAHLGRRFGGDDFHDTGLADLERRDRGFLDGVVRGDAGAVLEDVVADNDGRNYCGFPPLWVMTRSLGPGRGQVLGYGSDLSEGAVVTFAAGAL